MVAMKQGTQKRRGIVISIGLWRQKKEGNQGCDFIRWQTQKPEQQGLDCNLCVVKSVFSIGEFFFNNTDTI